LVIGGPRVAHYDPAYEPSRDMPSLRKIVLASLAVAALPLGRAAAQPAPPPGSAEKPVTSEPQPTPAPAETPASTSPESTESPAAALPPPTKPPPPVTPAASKVIAAPASPPKPEKRGRWKPLQVSVGVAPTVQDLGSEQDILGVQPGQDLGVVLDQWAMTLKGSLRVPMRVGFGRRNDGQEGTEPHALPRIVGSGSGDWNYIGLAPNASASLTLIIGNPLVSANIIYSTSHLTDPGYTVVNDLGIDQGYLALKFPDAFGNAGGIAIMAGIFSERFGMAGPYQKSSGYYSTYLFGRTHQAGISITGDFDLSEKTELVVEGGIGAKTEMVPFIVKDAQEANGDWVIGGDRQWIVKESDDFQGQGPQPYGSNFVDHAHAAVIYDDKLRLGAHYLNSWSPNDNALDSKAPEARLTVVGGDVHLDGEIGNAFVGYSHVDADELIPLGDAVQLLHSGTGRSFKLNYFGEKERLTGNTARNDSGTVDTVMTQFHLRIADLLHDPFGGRDLNLGLYSMWNHVISQKTSSHPLDKNIKDDKVKFGLDLDFATLKFMSIGSRFDRVIPRWADQDDAYSAITPRLTFYTRYKSKEQVILSYTHFFVGPETVPGSPYTDGYYTPDKDMIVLQARMSF
jgi:hypothetical protein